MQRYPKKIIEDYDLLLQAYPYMHELREIVAQEIANHFPINLELAILEIGIGQGETTEHILQKNRNVTLTAVDFDQTMIEKAKKKLEPFTKKHRINFFYDDANKFITKLNDSSFDVVTSSWTIHNFPKAHRIKLFCEIFRILKPGGLFINLDKYVLDNTEEEETSFQEVVTRLNKISKPALAQKAIDHEQEDRASHLIMKEQESLKQMKGIGFTKIRILQRINREAVLRCEK